jgi:hypothetical protein
MLGTGTPDPGNMFWSCYRMHVPDPQTATYGAICAQRLSKDAPALRRQHLHDRIADAEQNDEPARAKALLNMLQCEAKSKEWGSINRVTRPPSGQQSAIDTSPNTFWHNDV